MLIGIAQVFVGFVALIQIAIAVAETSLWKKVYKRLEPEIVFNQPEEAYKIDSIVKNVGLYNAFLAAGLIWGLIAQTNALALQLFFLSCVLIAGIFGAITLKWATLILQTVPSLVALIAVWYSYNLT